MSDTITKPGLRVGIATAGRFHLLDLARELDALGIDVQFYSYVPRRRAQMFGLPRRCHVALFPFVFPLVGFERLLSRILPRMREYLIFWTLDLLTIIRMRRCDAFICMSGIYVLAPRFARWRYGARIILHRGSRHILSQAEILAQLPDVEQVSSFAVNRELQGYDIADRIAVPSTHVAESFGAWPKHASKLFVSPYGVDLEQFPLRNVTPASSNPTLLFVGHWSRRKGVDVLSEAVEAIEGVRLIHVGALLDCPFPNHPRFIHFDPVSQLKLKEFYEVAHVFVLASREEGLALVQAQAIASGLPLVCTDRTGGADLAKHPGLARQVRVVPAGDSKALKNALVSTLELIKTGKITPITAAERDLLSWRHYALLHIKLIDQMVRTGSND